MASMAIASVAVVGSEVSEVKARLGREAIVSVAMVGKYGKWRGAPSKYSHSQ